MDGIVNVMYVAIVNNGNDNILHRTVLSTLCMLLYLLCISCCECSNQKKSGIIFLRAKSCDSEIFFLPALQYACCMWMCVCHMCMLLLLLCMCIFICMRVCLYVCLCVCACVCVRMHVSVCVCTCMFTYTAIFILNLKYESYDIIDLGL